jgi:RNA polymerase sigma factor (sigma-70 family)
MSAGQLGLVLRHIRELVGTRAVDDLTDGQLLQRFVRNREEAAFAALVERHGALVLGVCRRVLHHTQDAEDAFQATFLILARKAGSIRNPESVGSWLYGVAFHLATEAKARAKCRRTHERKAQDMAPAEPLADKAWTELRPILDEELHRLPEKYRLPLVLCYFQGKSNREAAAALGWPLGSMSRRLSRARELLRENLTRRGVTLSGSALATLLATKTGAAAPALSLLHATIKAGLLFAAGRGVAGIASAPALGLAQGVLHAMTRTKFKIATALVLTLGLVILGALTRLAAGPQQDKAPAAQPGGAEANTKGARSASKGTPPQQAKEKMTITGRVLDAGGKPVAGAAVAVLARARYANRLSSSYSSLQILGKTKADAKGRFRLVVTRSARQPEDELVVLAGNPGHGLGPVRLTTGAKKLRADIRLPREQVLRGRLVDLQGKPAAGVHVRLTRILGRLPRKSWVYLTFDPVLKDQPPWPKAAVTDAQGRFRISGLGPDWTVSLDTEHDRFARHLFEIKSADRKGGKEIRRSLAPARTIEGTVTYADIKKPIPNARLVFNSQKSRLELNPTLKLEARADARGRFHINPYAGNYLTVGAYPPAGAPYLQLHKGIEWPRADVVKQKVDLALVRGILVEGTVTEKPSGKPVVGAAVGFHPRIGNNKFYRREHRFATALSGPDGHFQAVVQAGPGHLLVNGPTPDFLKTEITSRDLYGLPILDNSRHYFDALVPLNLKPQKGAHRLTVSLRRGVTLTGKVVGPDGKPVARALMVCRTYLPTVKYFFGVFPKEVRGGRFELPGCDPKKKAEIFFCDTEDQLGAVVKISAKEAKGKPVTVQLQRCGTAKARFLDPKGKPLVNFHARIEVVITPGVPFVDVSFNNPKPMAETTYMSTFDPKRYGIVHSNAKGRITFPTLIPGATYWMMGTGGNRGLFNLNKEFKAKAGKILDLGDVVVKLEK